MYKWMNDCRKNEPLMRMFLLTNALIDECRVVTNLSPMWQWGVRHSITNKVVQFVTNGDVNFSPLLLTLNILLFEWTFSLEIFYLADNRFQESWSTRRTWTRMRTRRTWPPTSPCPCRRRPWDPRMVRVPALLDLNTIDFWFRNFELLLTNGAYAASTAAQSNII